MKLSVLYEGWLDKTARAASIGLALGSPLGLYGEHEKQAANRELNMSQSPEMLAQDKLAGDRRHVTDNHIKWSKDKNMQKDYVDPYLKGIYDDAIKIFRNSSMTYEEAEWLRRPMSEVERWKEFVNIGLIKKNYDDWFVDRNFKWGK